MTHPPLQRIGIAGLGLIGGSLAQALGQAWPGAQRWGHDVSPQAVTQALERGCIEYAAAGLDELLHRCDLVVLCQPLQPLIDSLDMAAAAPRLPVLCDVGSVKLPVLAAASRTLGARRGRFVGTHPIAGKAERGLAAAEGQIFRARPVVLCGEGADADALEQVRALWQAVGARPCLMSAARHDEVYAALSHTPQLLTWAYLRSLGHAPWRAQAGMLAGPGFQSFTRLGRSDPRLWAEIAMQNRGLLLAQLDRVSQELGALRATLSGGTLEQLAAHFASARDSLGAPPG